jgi:hypothetical protein
MSFCAFTTAYAAALNRQKNNALRICFLERLDVPGRGVHAFLEIATAEVLLRPPIRTASRRGGISMTSPWLFSGNLFVSDYAQEIQP